MWGFMPRRTRNIFRVRLGIPWRNLFLSRKRKQNEKLFSDTKFAVVIPSVVVGQSAMARKRILQLCAAAEQSDSLIAG